MIGLDVVAELETAADGAASYRARRYGVDYKLTVFPVGLERVPRKWKPTKTGPYAPAYEPDDPEASEPALIEPPVRVTPRRG